MGDDAAALAGRHLARTTRCHDLGAVLECIGTWASTGTAFADAKVGASPAPARNYQPAAQGGPGWQDQPGKVFNLTVDLDHIAEGSAAMDERRAIKTP
ncbi:MAG: hypothetical protein ACXVXP_04595 [Mycobacteriaceae bacterium]